MKCPVCQHDVTPTPQGRCPACGGVCPVSSSPDSIFHSPASGAATFVSEDWAKEESVESGGTADSLGTSDSLGTANSLGTGDSLGTADSLASADDPSLQTIQVNPDDSPPDRGLATLVDVDSLGSVDDGRADQTFVESEGRNLADRTFVGDDANFDLHDDLPHTYQDRGATAAELKTLQSNWSEADNGEPQMTIKSRADESESGSAVLGDTLNAVPHRSLRTVGDKFASGPQLAEYELLKVLGEGGMGVVWSARQTSVDRHVAVKMIKGPLAEKRSQRQKFLAEAVVTGDLDHPNIVPIYDVGTDAHGTLFYSMKQVKGTPWLKVLKEKTQLENLEILMRVADAVSFAHARGIIHRDLKPENVMLGEYGEVLVMDWGLALATGDLEKARQLRQSMSMGGTPAYMAPEMATGPLERIGPYSDQYLLGAILWEIITGKPPHPGKKVQECLLAAIRNIIAPTEKNGELVDIALKAMATNPADRYGSVREFQQAIRESFSHAESVAMADRAQAELELARRTDVYSDYAKSVFGFEEAFDLWKGNRVAEEGIDTAKLAYADSAYRKGDYDLGATLLREDQPSQRELLNKIRTAKAEREARQHRLRLAKQLMAGLGILLFAVITTALLWIRSERNFAIEQKQIAEEQEKIAVEQKQIALEQRQVAIDERNRAEQARLQALAAEKVALAAREQEASARQEEAAARQQEAAAREQEAAARRLAEQAKLDEEYEAYIARIGLAAAKIEENAFNVALTLLNECPPALRNWEWGRLMHLCQQISQEYFADGPIDSIAISPDGTKFVAGSWDRKARVWDLKTQQQLFELPQATLYVHAVAWSPDQRVIVTGGNDPQGLIRFWDAASGRELGHANGHHDAVVSVHFSPDGKQLLSTSYDQTAKLWDLTTLSAPRELQTLTGHNWWVWDAAFHPEFNLQQPDAPNQLVTVSQDGKAIVWEIRQQGNDVAANTVATFSGHQGPVYTVAFSPDGQSIATAGYDKRILLWNPSDLPAFSLEKVLAGEKPELKCRELLGHTAPIESLAFSAEGEMLISGARDNAVKAWSVSGLKAMKTFRGHHSAVRSVAISRDGRSILSGGQDQRAIVWSVEDYEEIRVLNGRQLAGHQDAILNATFSRDGHTILTASRDRTARTWDADTGAVLKTFAEGHDYLASSAVFFPDGRTLITSAADNTVRMWNVSTGTQFLRLGQTGRTAALALSSDARWLVTGSEDDAAKLWKVADLMPFAADGEAIRSRDQLPEFRPISDHHGRITAVAFAPQKNLLLTCDANGRCLLRDVETDQLLWNVKHHTRRVNACRFIANGTQILTASSDHTVSRLDAATGEELASLILKHAGPVIAMDLSADSQQVLTVESLESSAKEQGARVHLWDTATARRLESFEVHGYSVNAITFVPHTTSAAAVCSDNTVRLFRLQGESPADRGGEPWLDFQKLGGLVWSVAYAHDGRSMLTVGGSEARLWDLGTRREKMAFSPHGAVAAANFSPDGKQIITGSWDNSAKIWNVQTAQAVRRLENGHQGYINSVVYSPDGKRVLTASDDATAKLWNLETAEVMLVLNGHVGRVRQAIFSPDGKQILTVGSDRTARLWDAETGQPVGQPFVGHRWSLLCGAFSPDGQRVLTGSEDNTARLWNSATGECIATYEGHTAAVTSVAFSQDGRRVFTASQDNSAKLWDATPKREGTEILTLTGHSEELTSIAVSPNGRQILTASRDGTAVLWMTSDWQKAPPLAEFPHLKLRQRK
ncbi:protein kinase domain-containing protein [Planctomicrobium sp. SH664]|uniref:WD40 repeat domain-containing serine/threonine protein kinase n=1 Tax=Planctomicrobium sp. SH664 TaxID=3448125 RepID=UPI003F5B4D7D